MNGQFHQLARHTHYQRHLIIGVGAQFAQFIEPSISDATAGSPGTSAQKRAWRDPHRLPVWVIGRQSVGHLTCALPASPGSPDVTIGGPRAGAHVPAKSVAEIICGLQVCGDQRGVLVCCRRVASLDSGGEAAVKL
jgi:hypothetical protein